MWYSLSLTAFVSGIVWLGLRFWYTQLVDRARASVTHEDGRQIPGMTPKLLVGNLGYVYSARNKLAAYNGFHRRFGDIVQIFWLWRQQLSISNYRMAQSVLVQHQSKYEKFPPNSLLKRLYGTSVLTKNGADWKRSRLLLNDVFTKQRVASFHEIFVDYALQLADAWDRQIANSSGTVHRDIYPDLTALFLDIIGTAAIGHSFGALQGKSDDFLSSFNLIVNQSTRPPHQFTTWWKYLPLPSNFKLARAFATVDHHLTTAIQERRSSPHRHASGPPDVLDLLLQARDELGSDEPPLSDREVRDNVLAIVANGYETVATSTALTLHLLACHPDSLERVRDEIDRAFSQHGDRLTKEAVAGMSYLDCVIQESLRLCPPMAGLQRISTQPDRLEGWSFPSQQVVGISLVPLHHSAQHFGEYPEQFRPERYREGGGCPFHSGSSAREGAERSHRHEQCASEPLTFGDGARKCLGETFARYEMKVVLATLLHRFHVQSIPDRSPNLELSKFGIFLSMIPENGVEIALSLR